MTRRGTSAVWTDGWVLGGLGVMVLGAGVDLALSDNVSGVLAVPVLATSIGTTAPRTASVGVLAVAGAAALAVHDHTGLSVGAVRVVATAIASLIAVFSAARRASVDRQLHAVEHVADVAQHALLLPIPSTIGRYRLASAYISASREAQLGGDFYELVDSEFGPRLIVGDVRGKGVDAIELAAVALRCFRDAALTTSRVADVVRAVNRCVTSGMHAEDFITAVIIELAPDGELRIMNCGHHPPARIGPGGWDLAEGSSYATPFGFSPEPDVVRVRLSPGERLLVYTDGLVEARRPSGEFIDLDEFVNGLGELTAAEALHRIIETIRTATGGQINDDVAAVLIEMNGAAPVPV